MALFQKLLPFSSLISTRFFYERLETEEPDQPEATNLVYREELCKEPREAGRCKYWGGSSEKQRHPPGSGAADKGDGAQREKGVRMRVKVRMTKQEAIRLLSKCKDGGVLDYRDVAVELVQIPMNCITVENLKGEV